MLKRIKSLHPSRLDLITQIIILVVISKLVVFLYLFNLEFIEPYGRLELNEWWLIFHRWDSAYYDRIAALGYIDLSHWAFMPAFPAAIKTINIFVNYSAASTALAGIIFGILWIPIYYKVASSYMGEKYSKYSTLLFAFFPTVYLFTSLGYTEGLWLTTTLLGWCFYRKDKHYMSSITLAVSALTRLTGIVLPVIIFFHQLVQKKIKQALIYLLPVIGLIFWGIYGFVQTGEIFAPLAALQKTVWDPHLNFLEVFLIPLASGKPPIHWNDYSVFLLITLATFTYLYLRVFQVDKVLGVYSVCLLAIYLFTGYFMSLSRYLPFTFPIWINLKVEKKSTVVLYVFFSIVLALMLWIEFLNNRWIG